MIEEVADDDGGNAPRCGDNEVNGDEQCDGSAFASNNCGTMGFDEGEVTCNSSCQIETSACIILDEDLDGLSIHDELAIGTDPLNPDSDTDGLLDGAEVTGGADPLNMFSWPQGVGQWPTRLWWAGEAGLMGVGTQPGQVSWNFIFTDHLGQQVELYQFYGYKIVVSVGAVWCGPCQQAASGSQVLWDQHRESGVMFIEQLVDGATPGVDATEQNIQTWASQYGLQYPVVISDSPMRAQSLPTFYVINSDMTVSEKIEGWGGDATITAALSRAH